MRKTKIICTMGPATDSDEVLKNRSAAVRTVSQDIIVIRV